MSLSSQVTKPSEKEKHLCHSAPQINSRLLTNTIMWQRLVWLYKPSLSSDHVPSFPISWPITQKCWTIASRLESDAIKNPTRPRTCQWQNKPSDTLLGQLSPNPHCAGFSSIWITETLNTTLWKITEIHRQVVISIISLCHFSTQRFLIFSESTRLSLYYLTFHQYPIDFSKFLINIFSFFHQPIDLSYASNMCTFAWQYATGKAVKKITILSFL